MIGLGHFMRCLTLADVLAERGARVRFVCRHLTGDVLAMLRNKGMSLDILPERAHGENVGDLEHSGWLGVPQEVDARDTLDALGEAGTDWLVVDHYALDARWERVARGAAARILVIDDIADREHDCEVLLDQNLHPAMERRYDGRISGDTRRLLGPRYALLREEFRRLRASLRQRDGQVRRVFVLLSGTDPRNATEKVARALASLDDPVSGDVIVGAEHPARERVLQLCAAAELNVHTSTPEVAALMARADLAIGATGVTSWERCCLGLPTIAMTLAQNQVNVARGLAAAGAIMNLGDADALSTEEIALAITNMRASPERVRAMSAAAARLVDGWGACRVADCMMEAA